MKKIVFALTLCFFVAGPAFAVMTLTMTDSYGTTGGGEFLLKPTNSWPFAPTSLGEVSGKFESFCVEKNEYINSGGTFYAVLNAGAVNGGNGGQTPPGSNFDPLDPRTAYLYDQFISGTLAGYAYDTSGSGRGAIRVRSANALQHVIWYIEDEENMAWTPGDNSLMDKFYKDALSNYTPGSIGVGLVGWLRIRRKL